MAEPKSRDDNHPLRERKGEILNLGVEYCGDPGTLLVKGAQERSPMKPGVLIGPFFIFFCVCVRAI